ncbi:MAG TPA: two-component regulator propeller domain-containing protein [Draconibacterium sp.]|nr:two-component regulator propeller domain-containing protein [Draconibacterium sp.]
MLKYLLLIFSVFLLMESNAQQKQGNWKDYLSYTEATKIALATNKVFCATNGGLFYSDLQDNSVNKVSEIMQLSDFGIKTIAYNQANDVLVVAYNSSNIDLIFNTKVVNLSDIKRKQLTNDKTINNISFIGDEAYLSCGFGIVVINLKKQEIKDTYLIGEAGTALAVNDVETDGTYLYAATSEGILKAALEGTNLADFQNWNQITDIPHSSGKFNHLAMHAGKLIANYTPDQWDQDQLYILNGNIWETYSPQIRFSYDIQSNGEYLSVASRDKVFVIDNTHQIVKELNRYKFSDDDIFPISPRSVAVPDNGIIWIADFANSMVKVSGDQFEPIRLNSPFDNLVFSLNQFDKDLWVAPGGTKGWELPRFQRFRNDQWDYFTKNNHPELDGFFNILSVAADPFKADHFFVASWGGGVLEYQNDEFQNRFTNKNSPLQSALPTQPDEPYVRVAGLDFDSQGNLWITNSEVAQNLHSLSPDGKWASYTLPEVANRYNLGQVLVNSYDDKWIIILSGHDMYVVDKTGDKKKRLLVTSYFNNGENEIYNRMNDIYSIAEDNAGAIWIGTAKGVAVYNNPEQIWESTDFYAIQPSLDLEDGLYHPLLENETVTAIAVDGANRKWLGTKNSGVYLVSESGTEEILHFTTNDSPLFSDNITSITINQKNGEVFIGTEKGMISYMGEAIAGKATYDSVYVYPNPVRETYDGPVTITNLIENSEVKITDIAGNLVFRTTSLGGQAVWDGTNLNGRRVKTGVYLVFCNDEFGEETHITKLLFIN